VILVSHSLYFRGVVLIKQALKSSIGPSIGVVIGNVLWRITNPELYNETWPPIFVQAALYLLVGYIVSFLVVLLIKRIKGKIKNVNKGISR
jgi:uncharacterized membrane-anchored protein YhcB (DUF1043 family)